MRGQGDITGSVRAQIPGQTLQDTTVCIDRDQIVSTRYPGPNSWAIKVPQPVNLFFFDRFPYLCRTHFRKNFLEILNPFFLRALKVTEIFKFLRFKPRWTNFCLVGSLESSQ